jgi:hypothetical protein
MPATTIGNTMLPGSEKPKRVTASSTPTITAITAATSMGSLGARRRSSGGSPLSSGNTAHEMPYTTTPMPSRPVSTNTARTTRTGAPVACANPAATPATRRSSMRRTSTG